MSDNRSIGIFDSGLGGLTVLKTLAQEFPNESFLYVGDVARLPYGNKSPETIRKYGEQILRFLMSRDVKALIIACNTASTVFIDEDNFNGIPLYNVIVPGAKAALAQTKSQKIGVIGTNTTVLGHVYKKTILHLEPKSTVIEVACPLFVPLAEEGMANDPVTELMAKRYLAPLISAQVDTLVLGCTHYPLLKADISKVMGEGVHLIESGIVLANDIRQNLGPSTAEKRQLTICTTDVTGHFERLAQQIMSPEKIPSLERIVL